MKKIALLLVTILSINLSFAQEHGDKKHDKRNHEKIKALKVAHITDKLELTAKEAQAFWPVYNSFEAKKEALKKAARPKKENKDRPKFVSDAEANKIINEILDRETEKLQLKKNYISEVQKVLPAKKVMKLMRAERSFKRKMLQHFKRRNKREHSKDRK